MGINSIVIIKGKNNQSILLNKESGSWMVTKNDKGISDIKKRELLGKKNKYQRPTFPIMLTIHLTNNCNLNCKYCFAGSGKDKARPSFDRIKKVIDDFLSKTDKNCCINMQGGEVFLNLDDLRNLLEYSQKTASKFGKNLHFTIQTNGTIINKKILDVIRKYRINLGISLDGPKEIHDLNRQSCSGGGSFDRVIKNIHTLQKEHIDFGVIAVLSEPKNMGRVVRFFLKNKIYNFSFIPIRPQGRSKKACIDPNLWAGNELKAFDLLYSGNNYQNKSIYFDNIIRNLESILGIKRYFCSMSPCGGGTELITIDNEGNYYPCDAFYGIDEFKNSSNATIAKAQNSKEFIKFKKRNLRTIPECRSCNWQFFCGGGCAADAYSKGTGLGTPSVFCDYYKKIYEGLIWKIAKNPESLKRIPLNLSH